jgi:PEP-CTERM motif
MRTQKIALSTVLALALSAAMTQAQIFSFSALSGATMQFNGSASSFQFNNAPSGNQFSITLPSTSTAFGLQGSFTGGPWSYGTVMNDGGGLLTASVNPLQAVTLSINDGAGHLATANVTWGVLDTFGTAGGENAGLAVNLSDLSYTGLNHDLQTFFASPAGTLDLSFQFTGMTLNDLTSGSGPYTTSFSGSLAPTPEPGSLLVAGLGVVVLLGRRVFKR